MFSWTLMLFLMFCLPLSLLQLQQRQQLSVYNISVWQVTGGSDRCK